MFRLKSDFQPSGDQPQAIEELVTAFTHQKRQTLLGVTGSGKTFTIAHLIERLQRPALVMAHNKTLAAQLFTEFRSLFPENAVHYFVSYYDYYQPEAYVPSSDTYIQKDATINDAIDRMRHGATRALFERQDVIIVSSVSCIYGLGSAESYYDLLVMVQVGEEIERDTVLRKLTDIQYERNDIDFHRGTFRVRGDIVEILPAHENEEAVRIEWFGDEIESITLVDPLRGRTLKKLDKVAIYPSTHYAVSSEARGNALETIKTELKARLQELRQQNKLVEAQRLEQRTMFDLEMMVQMGYCNGIENYSRHLTGRPEGAPPPTLLDYLPKDYLMVVDESHQTIPQVGGMYKGDRSRKQTLVDHGFRLPSALDNRPLRFDEYNALLDKVVYVSATPGGYEIEQSHGVVVEQIIRPTGLLDPPVTVKPASTQVDDLLGEIQTTLKGAYRVLVTTLTKRMAEDLTEFLGDAGIKVRYLHSDIDTLERVALLQELRLGTYDVLVGVNLLREGLDLPEVGLVAILDADKEGFLRSSSSLIQTIGRAARNVDGRVILYGDKVTASMRQAMEETDRRRALQHAHNQEQGITPTSVRRSIQGIDIPEDAPDEQKATDDREITPEQIPERLKELRLAMMKASEALEFEQAAVLRDRIKELEEKQLL